MNSTSAIPASSWLFLTNHLHVLACIARQPSLTVREIAGLVGVTERGTAEILRDLEEDGYLTRHRRGRRNGYELHLDRPLRHRLHEHRSVGELLAFLDPAVVTTPPAARAKARRTSADRALEASLG